jgi:hypothetical protein
VCESESECPPQLNALPEYQSVHKGHRVCVCSTCTECVSEGVSECGRGRLRGLAEGIVQVMAPHHRLAWAQRSIGQGSAPVPSSSLAAGARAQGKSLHRHRVGACRWGGPAVDTQVRRGGKHGHPRELPGTVAMVTGPAAESSRTISDVAAVAPRPPGQAAAPGSRCACQLEVAETPVGVGLADRGARRAGGAGAAAVAYDPGNCWGVDCLASTAVPPQTQAH